MAAALRIQLEGLQASEGAQLRELQGRTAPSLSDARGATEAADRRLEDAKAEERRATEDAERGGAGAAQALADARKKVASADSEARMAHSDLVDAQGADRAAAPALRALEDLQDPLGSVAGAYAAARDKYLAGASTASERRLDQEVARMRRDDATADRALSHAAERIEALGDRETARLSGNLLGQTRALLEQMGREASVHAGRAASLAAQADRQGLLREYADLGLASPAERKELRRLEREAAGREAEARRIATRELGLAQRVESSLLRAIARLKGSTDPKKLAQLAELQTALASVQGKIGGLKGKLAKPKKPPPPKGPPARPPTPSKPPPPGPAAGKPAPSAPFAVVAPPDPFAVTFGGVLSPTGTLLECLVSFGFTGDVDDPTYVAIASQGFARANGSAPTQTPPQITAAVAAACKATCCQPACKEGEVCTCPPVKPKVPEGTEVAPKPRDDDGSQPEQEKKQGGGGGEGSPGTGRAPGSSGEFDYAPPRKGPRETRTVARAAPVQDTMERVPDHTVPTNPPVDREEVAPRPCPLLTARDQGRIALALVDMAERLGELSVERDRNLAEAERKWRVPMGCDRVYECHPDTSASPVKALRNALEAINAAFDAALDFVLEQTLTTISDIVEEVGCEEVTAKFAAFLHSLKAALRDLNPVVEVTRWIDAKVDEALRDVGLSQDLIELFKQVLRLFMRYKSLVRGVRTLRRVVDRLLGRRGLVAPGSMLADEGRRGPPAHPEGEGVPPSKGKAGGTRPGGPEGGGGPGRVPEHPYASSPEFRALSNKVLKGDAPREALSPEARNRLADFFEHDVAPNVGGSNAEAARLFNLDRARYLRGEISEAPRSLPEWMERHGLK